MSELTHILRQNREKAEKIRSQRDYAPDKLPPNEYLLGKETNTSENYNGCFKIVAEDDPENDPNYALGHRPD